MLPRVPSHACLLKKQSTPTTPAALSPNPPQLGITGDGSAAAVGAALPSRKSGAASARRRVAGLSRRALAAAEQGRVVVSGGLLAASLVYRSYARTERTRRLVVLFTLLLSCVQAALPAVLRALCTKPPIGSSPLEKFAFFVILWYRLAEYFMLNMILYTVVQDFIHRAFVVRELGKLVRVTPRPLGRDAGAPAPAAAARSGRRSRRQFRAAKSNLQTRRAPTLSPAGGAQPPPLQQPCPCRCSAPRALRPRAAWRTCRCWRWPTRRRWRGGSTSASS